MRARRNCLLIRDNARDSEAASFDVDIEVLDAGSILELHAFVLQEVTKGLNEAGELVVLREPEAAEVAESRQILQEAVEVPLHLCQRLIVLEGEHGPPQSVEVGREEVFAKPILDCLVIGVFLFSEQ